MFLTADETSTTTNGVATSSDSLRQASAVAKKPKKRGAASAKPRKAKASSKAKPRNKARKAKAGGAKIAKGATYALVARLGPETYRKAWRTVERLDRAAKKADKPRVSMSSWLISVIEKAAK